MERTDRPSFYEHRDPNENVAMPMSDDSSSAGEATIKLVLQGRAFQDKSFFQ